MPRRLKALTTICRLADRRLEEEATRLTALQSRISELAAEKAVLRHKRAHEGRILSAEAAPYVARFLRSLRAEETRLDGEIAVLVHAARQSEERVRAAFLDAKGMDHARDGLRSAARAAEDRAERQRLDEFAVMRPGPPGLL